MTVTDDQQPQLGKLNFKNKRCKLQTSLSTELSVLPNCDVKVHTARSGIHHRAILGTQWQTAALVTIKSSSGERDTDKLRFLFWI